MAHHLLINFLVNDDDERLVRFFTLRNLFFN